MGVRVLARRGCLSEAERWAERKGEGASAAKMGRGNVRPEVAIVDGFRSDWP